MNERNPIANELAASTNDLSRVVISWEYKDDEPIALSHFNDAVWIAPAEGALAAIPERSRQLDTTRYPLDMRIQMKRALYCFLRHPIRSATDVNLATLIKRHQALLALTAFMKREGLTALSAPNARKFLLEETKRFKHIESVTSTVATLKGLAIYCERGYVKLEVSLSYPFKHGAKAIAQALWRDAHGSDFHDDGVQPFEDDDITLIVRNAHHYIRELAPQVLRALTMCLDIADRYPEHRSNRSQEALCYREQQRVLQTLNWSCLDSGIYQWPPRTMSDVLGHVRMCCAACVISCGFATGARRSELCEIRDDCLSIDHEGKHLLEIVHMKNAEERHGHAIKIPVDEMVVQAISAQAKIKLQIARHMRGSDSPSVATDYLFVRLGRQKKEKTGMEEGRLSAFGFHALLRDFKKRVTPDIAGEINTTRFRKSVARLVTLAMEGAPLILQHLFGHRSYRTTLGYMLASPMINDELASGHKELLVKNLRILYQEREGLLGGGATSFRSGIQNFSVRAAMQAEPEVGMSEDDFIEHGLEMVERGQMTLNMLGTGMYCLKSIFARGPCNHDPSILLPNVGRCQPSCSHHLILGSNRGKLSRQVQWLERRLAEDSLSPSMRKYFSANRDILVNVLFPT